MADDPKDSRKYNESSSDLQRREFLAASLVAGLGASSCPLPFLAKPEPCEARLPPVWRSQALDERRAQCR